MAGIERSDGKWVLPDGHEIDGRWMLHVAVTDLPVDSVVTEEEAVVRVQLVEHIGVAQDWSDHGLWWPRRNLWLTRTRSTLDQYGVQADSHLIFTPMHKVLRVQLPDLQYLNCRVDYSIKVFAAIIGLCKDLGIRYPEELSLCRVPDETFVRKGRFSQQNGRHTPAGGKRGTKMDTPNSNVMDGALNSSPRTPVTPLGNSSIYGNYTPASGSHNDSMDGSLNGLDMSLAISPQTPSKQARDSLLHPKNVVEKARLNAGWLDSSLSLMEQGIRQYDVLLLRFKYFAFYDMNPKYDAVRINQVYEHARWMIISDEIDCTEEESILFAALQLQVHLQSSVAQPDLNATSKSASSEDEIDAALTDLQISLEGSSSGPGDITAVPELADYLHFLKPKKFTLKGYKRVYLTFKDTYLSFYKTREEAGVQKPEMRLTLRGCEVSSDVHMSSHRYLIKLMVPSGEGMSELYVKCEDEEQYARWMAACRLATKGKTMADVSYDGEVSSILAFLNMQHPAPEASRHSHNTANSLDIAVEDFLSSRYLHRVKAKTAVHRIQEAHANVTDQTLLDAKMNYIKAWQSLPEYGIRHFTVRFRDGKREEVLGIAFNRLIRMDTKGNSVKTWRFNTMKEWKVNWEVKEVIVTFEEDEVAFICTSADCKQAHEFIGGYIFLSMRAKDNNQTLNQELFHRLTGGWQ